MSLIFCTIFENVHIKTAIFRYTFIIAQPAQQYYQQNPVDPCAIQRPSSIGKIALIKARYMAWPHTEYYLVKASEPYTIDTINY